MSLAERGEFLGSSGSSEFLGVTMRHSEEPRNSQELRGTHHYNVRHMFAAGSKVGPYEVLGLLGEGGMGQVYRGRDPRLGREVAIKVLARDALQDAEATGRLEREARAIAALSHPNIVAVYDVGREDGSFYLVTELLEGKTLRDAMQPPPMNWRRVVEIGASALPSPGPQAAAREFRVTVQLDQPNVTLRPGLTCDAEIVTDTKSGVVAVPLQAVVERSGRTGVFKIDDGTARFLPVTPGIIGGLMIAVDGLSEGADIVTGPVQALRELQDGTAIRRSR